MRTGSATHPARTPAELRGVTVLLFSGTGPRARSGVSVSEQMSRVLAEHVGVAGPIEIERDAAGRPSFADARLRDAALSTSSTVGYRAVALSPGGPIGVDIEAVLPEHADPALADRALAPGERLGGPVCNRCPSTVEPAAAFTRLWTRKEAALKLLGLGLRLNPQSITVNCCGPATLGGDHVCRLHSLEAAPGVWLTTATHDATPPEIIRLNLGNPDAG